MLEKRSTYEETYRDFRWAIPSDYNIARDACDRWAEADPGRLALLHRRPDGSTDRWSYHRLSLASNRFANVLRHYGIGRGDRVAILLPQCPETAIAHLGTYKIAGIALPLAALFGVEALVYRLRNAGAKAIVTNAAGLAKLAEIRAELPDLRLVLAADGGGMGIVDFHQALAEASSSFAPEPTGPDDPAMMIYTSGTTGLPKGALHGHRVLPGHIPGFQFAHEFFPVEGDLMWTPADWAWAGGLLNALLPSLALGVPVLAYRFEKFDPDLAFWLMAHYGVRNAFVPPTALKMLRTVENPLARFDLRLRTLGSAGEALGSETYEWARAALDLTVNEFYGQTECNIVLASCAMLGVSRAGAIGKAAPGHEVAVIGPGGAPVAAGTLGQIAVRRPDPVMFLEYWDRPDATAEKFVGDWMTTGDQGVMDEDGYVHFVGRDDDVITSAGYRIGPAEIEDCLAGHPAVALAAVVGKPDPLRTEIVKAYVRLVDGVEGTADLKDEIRAHVRTRLSAHEYPREIEFVEEIPLTTSGKVIRRFFRERAQADAAEEQVRKRWE
ncbi:AMP-dependent synthetase [Prosthecomicrobium hirschii]|uniref:AMP-dependent synthetase n=1 Tax=Prosthecodimorpha hirschii TaxID=665126 RepID=A0A0P6VT96_9HYPH|nr:AMP-binding protein [Prosthecomicrobium hirschii]KPL54006.1 AMP-dependent synthetase [Prosthecomicrobium hirschii]